MMLERERERERDGRSSSDSSCNLFGRSPATVFFIAAAAATGPKLINLDFLFANLRLGRCPTIHNKNNSRAVEKKKNH